MTFSTCEVMVIRARRTTTRTVSFPQAQVCALCGKSGELISLAAAARIQKAHPRCLGEWLEQCTGTDAIPLPAHTLVCLECLSWYQRLHRDPQR